MKARSILLVLAACAMAGAQAQPGQPAHKTLFVRCGRLLFDTDKPPMSPAAVIITDGKITSLGPNLSPPAGAEQVDFSRYTVLPGLLDAHIHLWTGPRAEHPSPQVAALRAQRAMKYALDSGVAAVRVLGSYDFLDVALRQAIEEGTIAGPHIIPAGHAISIPAGHGDQFTFPETLPLEDYYTPLNGFINSPADAEKAVHLQIKYGARVIKILASGGVGSPLDSPYSEQVSPEELRVIVEQAHMAQIKVAAHAENIRSITEAIEAGVDSIEHGSELTQRAIDLMKQRNTILVPTVFIPYDIVTNGERNHLPDYMLRKARDLYNKHEPSYQMALKAGVTIAAGSDQSYEPGKGTVLDEIATMVHFGATPQQALTAATKTNAMLMGFPDMGTVAEGKEGDLVAVEGDPLSDVTAVKKVRAVVFQGRLVAPER
ncbi:MAG: amidohydrolase family protein [Acidobacteria bacterium]|nr:amidohydrolase family protein [Acidobacteriota bacterium]